MRYKCIKSLTPLACIFLCMVISICCFSAKVCADLLPADIENFLNLIANDWKGNAVQTPLGPVGYSINFTKNPNGHVSGAAYLNRSTHYWDFYRQSNQLKLKFLSTFAGNTQPIYFAAQHYSDSHVEFISTSRNDVKVIIKPGYRKMVIRIFLRNKPHVIIELAA